MFIGLFLKLMNMLLYRHSVKIPNVKPRVVEPSCLAYAILAPLALFFVDLHKASLPQNMRYSTLSKHISYANLFAYDIRLLKECAQNMSVRRSLKNGAGRIL